MQNRVQFRTALASRAAEHRPFWMTVCIARSAACALALFFLVNVAAARFRQPSAEYQARRAALRGKIDGPVVIFGYTGHEDASEVAIFFQEPYFYYLTGHDEPGAAVLLIPDTANGK